MSNLASRVKELYHTLHQMPEVGFEEIKTSTYLAEQLQTAGYAVRTGVGGTGIIGTLTSGKPGPVVGLRADMDALAHTVDGKDVNIHSCGHDSHSAMVLTAAEEIARRGLNSGTIKILFQPAEEKFSGASRMIEDGAIEDLDFLFGIHLRPIQEAKFGQATPALYHGASYILQAVITGAPSHGARPHLGINAIDAAAAAVYAVNSVHVNPAVPATAKVTKLQAGGAALNAIPDKAYLALDVRAQYNDVMEELIQKVTNAIKGGAAALGAAAEVKVTGGAPAAEYDKDATNLARKAIVAVLGADGLLDPVITPGGEDFHYFVKHKPTLKTAYMGLGVDLTPGLHHPKMQFNTDGLINGVNILLYMVNKQLGLKA